MTAGQAAAAVPAAGGAEQAQVGMASMDIMPYLNLIVQKNGSDLFFCVRSFLSVC